MSFSPFAYSNEGSSTNTHRSVSRTKRKVNDFSSSEEEEAIPGGRPVTRASAKVPQSKYLNTYFASVTVQSRSMTYLQVPRSLLRNGLPLQLDRLFSASVMLPFMERPGRFENPEESRSVERSRRLRSIRPERLRMCLSSVISFHVVAVRSLTCLVAEGRRGRVCRKAV